MAQQQPFPERFAGEVALRDGRRVRVRPVRPDDASRLERLFESLSPRSRYQRFLQHMRELPPAMLDRFVRAEFPRSLALAALSLDEVIAVGRYAPAASDGDAEFALVVADAWQAHGIGRALLERLCDAARDAGYAALYGHILDANREMLALAARLGFVQHARSLDEVTVVRKLK